MLKFLEKLKAFYSRHPLLDEAVELVSEIDRLMTEGTSDDVGSVASDIQSTLAVIARDIEDYKSGTASIRDLTDTIAVLKQDIADLRRIINDIKAAKAPQVVPE